MLGWTIVTLRVRTGGASAVSCRKPKLNTSATTVSGRMISPTQAERKVGRSTTIKPADSRESETQTSRKEMP